MKPTVPTRPLFARSSRFVPAALGRWLAAAAGMFLLPTPGSLAAAEGLAGASVEYRMVDLAQPAEGVVEAVRQATVAAQVQGRLMEAKVDAGQRVKAGELLMRIDEREVAAAAAGSEANVAQAQARLADARAGYERTRSLLERKFVSQSALDAAEAGYKAARAAHEAALAGRGQTAAQRSFTSITSPISGVVAQRHTEPGEMAVPGKPLVTVFDPSALRVVATLPQYRFAELKSGLKAKVEFPESGRWVDAAAVELLPAADARTHTLKLRVILPPGLDGVVPGMAARAHFVTGQAKRLVIPASAVLRRGEVTAAYVIDSQGRPSLRQVRIGERYAGDVEVLSGLAAGERVALDPVKATLVR